MDDKDLPMLIAKQRKREGMPEFMDFLTRMDRMTELTVFDPCCGAGHFLRVAFDKLMQMYREQLPEMMAYQIIQQIFKYNLHGFDIDERAVQLCKFTLYLRACEFIQAEHKNEKRTYNWRDLKLELPENILTAPQGEGVKSLTMENLQRYCPQVYENQLMRETCREIFSLMQDVSFGSLALVNEKALDKLIADYQSVKVA